MHLNLSSPKEITWWIAVILGVLGILSHFMVLSFFSTFSFWLVAIGFILLALATYFRNL